MATRKFKTISILIALFLVTLTLPSLISHTGATGTTGPVSFVSDTSWQVYNTDPALGSRTLLGFAQFVCLTATIPSSCPAGATIYGHSTGGWSSDVSSIPGAHWIWAPGINGTTAPAEFNQFYFSKSFQLNGTNPIGLISISADDFAEVRVNGHIVGSIGSISNYSTAAQAQASLTTFNLTPFLRAGPNILTVRAENGPFGICCPSNYAGNPAGVVFGGFFVSPSIQIHPSSGAIGTKVLVQGSGIPSFQVEVTFDDVFLGIASLTNGTFTFTFNVPDAQPGLHLVKAVDPLNGISAVANFTVTRVDTLAINVDVGTLYFPGDTATIYTLATLSGMPLNATSLRLQLTLMRPDGSNVTLTATFIGGGMFRSAYQVPTTGQIGTYAVIAKSHVANVQDTSALTTFEVKPTWLSAQTPALTTTAVALTGALAVGAVVWKRGVFRSKIE